MGGDPVPGPHDILRTWYELPWLKGRELEEAIEKLEAWLKKVKRRGASRGRWKTVSGKRRPGSASP